MKVLAKRIAWVALFAAALALLTYCDRGPSVARINARIEQQRAQCEQRGGLLYVWKAVDVAGDANVYARCIGGLR